MSREEIEQLKKLLGFEKRNSSEKNSEPNISLKRYFKIEDITPYQNISIEELNFNNRVMNCLKLNSYRTLEDILKTSEQTFINLRNFGLGSYKNLLETLKIFFFIIQIQTILQSRKK